MLRQKKPVGGQPPRQSSNVSRLRTLEEKFRAGPSSNMEPSELLEMISLRGVDEQHAVRKGH